MKNKKTTRRRTFIINPAFQWGFVCFMSMMALFVIGISYCANLYFFWSYIQMGVGMNLSPDHVFFQFLSKQQNMMKIIFLVESIAVFLMLTIFGLIYSHRIAGPLYKLRKHLLESAKNKKFKYITFRKDDFFPELANAYNHLVAQKDRPKKVSEKSKNAA